MLDVFDKKLEASNFAISIKYNYRHGTGIIPITAVSGYRREFITKKVNDSENSDLIQLHI